MLVIEKYCLFYGNDMSYFQKAKKSIMCNRIMLCIMCIMEARIYAVLKKSKLTKTQLIIYQCLIKMICPKIQLNFRIFAFQSKTLISDERHFRHAYKNIHLALFKLEIFLCGYLNTWTRGRR